MSSQLEIPMAETEALSLRAVLDQARQKDVVHMHGLKGSAAMFYVARAVAQNPSKSAIVMVDSLDVARATLADLRGFLPQNIPIFLLPASDHSPWAEVASDRMLRLERARTLGQLARLQKSGAPAVVIAQASALVRYCGNHNALANSTEILEVGGELIREVVVAKLASAGYARVPLVEDHGTFAFRGAIFDVYPVGANSPYRIDVDGDMIVTIEAFDVESQRTESGSSVEKLVVGPAEEYSTSGETLDDAKRRLRDLCDSLNLPTRRTKELLEELTLGRITVARDALLPAFVAEPSSLWDFFAAPPSLFVVDPEDVHAELVSTYEDGERDREARIARGEPAFPFANVYVTQEKLVAGISRCPRTLLHGLQVLGANEKEEDALAPLFRAEHTDALDVRDQTELRTAMANARLAQKRGGGSALTPLVHELARWNDLGYRALIVARSHVQAERIASLLRGRGLHPEESVLDLTYELALQNRASLMIAIASLSAGFVSPGDKLALITEDEILGTHKQVNAKKRKAKTAQAFLEDLAELEVGDYVVHVHHGIGRYLGLKRMTLGLSKLEELQGKTPVSLEALEIEYANGDKLILPVTRLNQVQKFAGKEGHTPKLDKIGGQSFQKTKSKVKAQVREMADELLRLYAERAAIQREPVRVDEEIYREFEATFAYEETEDQAQAIEDCLQDLSRNHPMDRIVCGDVGFGKTEVAIRTAFRVAMGGRQVAILCPTTVLAQQHYQNLKARLAPYPLRVEQLSRFVDEKTQSTTALGLKDGAVDIVVGTHRILSKDIHFKQLGLLVVDEEQRFGVVHKERIKKIRNEVDVLTLTATPIPRTLQLAVGGLRELSVIATPPTDRRAVRTFVTRFDDNLICEAIERELARQGQVFFVYNRIEGLYERANKLKTLLPHVRFAVAHGQMSENALEDTMTDFVMGKYDVLCATAIIESGLDIPRANTILIDRADTFGMAQLYQLRGRVGRSKERAYCYLITPPPNAITDEARARIETLERFSELGAGFKVATLDMELRGAGDVLGASQSGAVAQVGFDLFLQMLEEQIAILKGEPVIPDVDTELHLDVPVALPEEYVDDVHLRLSLYKRFAQAIDEDDVIDIAREMENRFGEPPAEAERYVHAMRLRTRLRPYRVLACEATLLRVTLHLREDTPLEPEKVLQAVQAPKSPWRLSEDMRLTCRFDAEKAGDALARIEWALDALEAMK